MPINCKDQARIVNLIAWAVVVVIVSAAAFLILQA